MRISIFTSICFFLSCGVIAQKWPEHIIPNENDNTKYVTIGDVNNDNAIDVISVRGISETLGWFDNSDGQGNFSSSQQIGMINFPVLVTYGDLDGDGDLDVIGTSPFQPNDRLVWYENLDGQGNFSTANTIITSTQGQYTVAVADFDGDTDNDLVVVSKDDGALAWYENLDGQGNFSSSKVIVANYVTFTGLAVGDVDGDGDIDIVAGTNNTRRMSWFENSDGLGNFTTITEVSTPGLAILAVAISDVDGDGDNDIVGTSAAANLVAWWENLDGLGSFGSENTIATAIDVPFRIVADDLDNDKDIDVVITSASEDSVYWFENIDGDGNFSGSNLISNTLESTISVALGDIDDDGDIDVVSGAQVGDKLAWYENTTILNVPKNSLSNIKIYPNPVQTALFIENNSEIPLSNVSIIDAKGQTVLQKQGAVTVLNIAQLASGIYFVHIENSEGTKKVEKLVKE